MDQINYDSDIDYRLESPAPPNREVIAHDGRLVYLPNAMPDERVREVLQNPVEFEFYRRYNASDVELEENEDYWDALSCRTEGNKQLMTSLLMTKLSEAVADDKWGEAKAIFEDMLDVDPRARREAENKEWNRPGPPPLANEDDWNI